MGPMDQAPGTEAPPQPDMESNPEQPSSEVGKLVMTVSEGLSMLAQIMDKIPETPPEAKEAMAGVVDTFNGIIQGLAGGGGAPEQGAPPAAAGRSRGVPMPSPQGKPSSPAGM